MITIATRKSPLALAQTEMVAQLLRDRLGEQVEQLRIVTTGDQQTQWSLEKRGGKGLFTSELENALQEQRADIAVHSTKDLPGDMPAGLAIAGYLPRADARDVLVCRSEIEIPTSIATGSPRRRLQLAALFPQVVFSEIRGNVDTRLRKIAQDRVADATMLAAAGLARLGIHSWEGLRFLPMTFDQLVPAVGQAAIAIQCRAGEADRYASLFDPDTKRRVVLERAFQTRLGGGCHTAFAAHVTADRLHLFHELCGKRFFALDPSAFEAPETFADQILKDLKLVS